MSLTFCSPEFLRLTSKHPGIIPEYTGTCMNVSADSIIRISLSDIKNIITCKRQIKENLPELVDFHGSIFLDIGNQNVSSWSTFRSIWKLLISSATTRYEGLKCFGLAGSALLLPADREGHLSAEFLNAMMCDFSSIKEKWVGIPITPVFADHYCRYAYYIDSIAYKPFDAFHKLGFHIQGEVPPAKAKLTQLFANNLLSDFSGNTLKEKYYEFIKLLPHIERIRLIDINYMDPNLYSPNARFVDNKQRKSVKSNCRMPHPRRQACHPLNKAKQFIQEIYQSGIFNGIEIVELLLLLTGYKKVMRTSLQKKRFIKVINLFYGKNIYWKSIEDSAQYNIDKGKGGWSNLFDSTKKHRKNNHDYLVYIGLSENDVNEAYMLEGDNNSFGEIMSYPKCCIAAFERNQPISAKKQGDLVPIVAEQTIKKPPWSFLLNSGACYFEKSLISFYPCSYTCRNAKNYALEAFRLIEIYLPEYAPVLRKYLSSPVLYTEFRGIYLFLDSVIKGSTLYYDSSKIQMTTTNSIGKALRKGKVLRVSDDDKVQICNDSSVLKVLQGENVKMLIFNSDY